MITIKRDGKKYLLQQGVEVDASISLALFTQVLEVKALDNTLTNPVVKESNALHTVVGYDKDNEGRGRIDVLDTQSLAVQH